MLRVPSPPVPLLNIDTVARDAERIRRSIKRQEQRATHVSTAAMLQHLEMSAQLPLGDLTAVPGRKHTLMCVNEQMLKGEAVDEHILGFSQPQQQCVLGGTGWRLDLFKSRTTDNLHALRACLWYEHGDKKLHVTYTSTRDETGKYTVTAEHNIAQLPSELCGHVLVLDTHTETLRFMHVPKKAMLTDTALCFLLPSTDEGKKYVTSDDMLYVAAHESSQRSLSSVVLATNFVDDENKTAQKVVFHRQRYANKRTQYNQMVTEYIDKLLQTDAVFRPLDTGVAGFVRSLQWVSAYTNWATRCHVEYSVTGRLRCGVCSWVCPDTTPENMTGSLLLRGLHNAHNAKKPTQHAIPPAYAALLNGLLADANMSGCMSRHAKPMHELPDSVTALLESLEVGDDVPVYGFETSIEAAETQHVVTVYMFKRHLTSQEPDNATTGHIAKQIPQCVTMIVQCASGGYMLVRMDTCPPDGMGVVMVQHMVDNTHMFSCAGYARHKYDALKLRPQKMAELTALLMEASTPEGHTIEESWPAMRDRHTVNFRAVSRHAVWTNGGTLMKKKTTTTMCILGGRQTHRKEQHTTRPVGPPRTASATAGLPFARRRSSSASSADTYGEEFNDAFSDFDGEYV